MNLAQLQHWFQGHVAGPHERPRRAPDPHAERIAAVILPSSSLRAPERLGVYTRMYWLRLFDILGDDFPTVRHLCGAAVWEWLCRRYLTAHPSRHWSLGPLGAQLPEFLRGPIRMARKALCRDVARVELALQEVFHAPRCAVLGPDAFAAVPTAAWPTARLQPQHALQLLALAHPAGACIQAVRRDAPLPALARQQSWEVVWRQNGQSWRRTLTRPMYAGLRALASGATVGAALQAIAERWDGDPDALTDQVFGWFQTWVADGLFGAIMLA